MNFEKMLSQVISEQDLDDTPLGKGKYADRTPDELSDEDPEYLVYAYETWDIKPCSKAMYNYCKSRVSRG